jgi:Cu/Zn superoxide dismutase
MPNAPLRLLAIVAGATLLASCSSASLDPRRWFSKEETPAAKAREVPGVEAPLASRRSPVTGKVNVRESGELLVVQVQLGNGKPGTTYRVVFHANGNCTSPNAFSAGEPWSPPGAKDAPARLLPEIRTNSEGLGLMTARLRGVRIGGDTGLLNRSVLVYEGTTIETPKPDVPNNVVACGVFVRSSSLF